MSIQLRASLLQPWARPRGQGSHTQQPPTCAAQRDDSPCGVLCRPDGWHTVVDKRPLVYIARHMTQPPV